MTDTPEEKLHPNNDGETDSMPLSCSDGLFTMKISEDMDLRNLLRAGLVEAQGKNRDLIPMLVSWPHWLEDGIVCLFAKDLHRILHDAVQAAALDFAAAFQIKSLRSGFSCLGCWFSRGSGTH